MCIIDEIALGKIVDLVFKKIGEAISSAKWKELFVSTGEFVIKSPDKLDSFTKDLSVVFSKKNLLELSKKMKDRSGFEFSETLHNELCSLMAKYEIPPYDAEEYIRMFSQSIIGYIEEHDKEKTFEMFIGDFRKSTESKFEEVLKNQKLIMSALSSLINPKIVLFTIADIDSRIRRHSKYKGLSLDFFEIDDNEFQQKFKNSIDNKMIFVVGKSHEETIYRILNELKRNYSEKTVFVIESRAEWDKLENNNLSGCILIPKFYDENIPAISNNTNIFVYNEDEPCYSNEKLVLRKRTRKNLINALENVGIEHSDAYALADNTHGLYSALRKKLFNEASYTKNPWVESHTDVVIAALLCGKWTESEGDKLIFEDLTGVSYAECKKELLEYSYGETPFVVEFKGHRDENMQISSIEDAWEELDYYITDAMWNKFIKLLYEVLIVSEPIFDYPIEKHFEVSMRLPKSDWSQALKRGMLRTLVMRAFYRKHDENQYEVDNIIKEILETIDTTKRWGYIAQYMPELCEASPKAVIERLEKELESPSGLKELFETNDGDFMRSRHYYTYILFAVEQLLQQKQYVVRAIEWLWNMDSYDIKYSLSNSPKEILGTVFCAWINMSVLTEDKKMELAKKAVVTYPNAWEIIYSNFPNKRTTVFSTFSTPRHRSVDDPEDVNKGQLYKTYIEYLDICVNNINGYVEEVKKAEKNQSDLKKLAISFYQARQTFDQRRKKLEGINEGLCPYCGFQWKTESELQEQFSRTNLLLENILGSNDSIYEQAIQKCKKYYEEVCQIKLSACVEKLRSYPGLQILLSFNNYKEFKAAIDNCDPVLKVLQLNNELSSFDMDNDLSTAEYLEGIISAISKLKNNIPSNYYVLAEQHGFDKVYKECFSNNNYIDNLTVEKLKNKEKYIESQYYTSFNQTRQQLESLKLQEVKLSALQSQMKEYHASLKKAIDSYQQLVIKQIEIPFFLYCSRLLQSYQGGQGVLIDSKDSKIRFTVPGAEHDVLYTMSSGQLSAVLLAFSLVLNKIYSGEEFSTLFIDDPIQCMDDINMISFVELLRREFADAQIIISTHEDTFANYVKYKFSKYNLKSQSITLKDEN